MVVSKTIRSMNATGNLRYILNDTPKIQNETGHRVLSIFSQNVDKDYKNSIDALYTAAQFNVVRHSTKQWKLHHKDKKTQSEHLIFSFSDDEFDLSSPQVQARQAVELVGDFLKNWLGPTSQFVAVAQDDNVGHKLHVHAIVNSVNKGGKVLNTSLVTQTGKNGIRENFNQYLERNFQKVTGRTFTRLQPKQPAKSVVTTPNQQTAKAMTGGYSWKDELQTLIDSALANNTDMQSFKDELESNGVTITTKKARIGFNDDGTKIYRAKFSYHFVDSKGKKRRSVDFSRTKTGHLRGLGTKYTPDAIQRQLDLNYRQSGQDTINSVQNAVDQTLADLDKAVSQAVSSNATSDTPQQSQIDSSASVDSSVPADEIERQVASVAQRRRRNRQERVTAETDTNFERQDGPRMLMHTLSRTKTSQQIENTNKVADKGQTTKPNSQSNNDDLEL